MTPIDDFNASCNDARRLEQEINVGACRECGRVHARSADDRCMACEFTANITKAFPKTESYQHPGGFTVLDLNRVDFWGKR